MQLDHIGFGPAALCPVPAACTAPQRAPGPKKAPGPAPRTRRPRDRAARLIGTLNLLGGGRGQLIAHNERPWASITFAGTRHEMTWLFEGADAIEAGEYLIAESPDHEFTLPGQLVAEVAIDRVDHTLHPARLEIAMTVLVLDEA